MPEPASESKFRQMRETARSIFTQTLAAASIVKGFTRHVNCERGVLRVCEDLYDLDSYSRVLVIALGKAGHTMVEALSAQIGSSLEGIVASSVQPAAQVHGFRYFRGGHPTPNAESADTCSPLSDPRLRLRLHRRRRGNRWLESARVGRGGAIP